MSEPRRAAVIGTGLVGGSIALALRSQGWWVSGTDADADRAHGAAESGVIDAVGPHPDCEVTFIATPVSVIPGVARDALAATDGFVTDVGSVKTTIAEAVDDPRFVGGHPMAGSEQEGLAGARADLFHGAVWVLTPVAHTSDAAITTIRSVVASLGADVVAIPPDKHDRLVAVVSHVPHLAAATLMRIASSRSTEHRALLRLAAGGFRDMTRIAAGHPGIWPDICAENRDAIGDVLEQLIAELSEMRHAVLDDDRAAILATLDQARAARINLPTGAPEPGDLVEVRVPIFDRPGEVAKVTTLASGIDVNIYDLEIAHSPEGGGGVMILIVDVSRAERLEGALMAHDYHPSLRSLTTDH